MESVFVRTRGWRRCSALLALTAFVAAGCLGATASGSASVLPAASPTETASASASATPTAPSTAEPTSTSAATDLSSVPIAPSGAWKSIHWVSVPATPLLASSSPEPDASGVLTYSPSFKLAGWSRGFVGFSVENITTQPADKATTTTTTSYSSDGVHWHAGTVVQQQTSIGDVDIRGVFEGPAGLLAVEEAGACGDSWVEGLLTSRDGVTWQTVDTRKAFGKAVIWNVSGGSTGFVATDTTGTRAWTSRDGRSWQPVKLDSPAFARSRIDDGTAFSAGYVLTGSTQVTGARNCGAAIADPSATPAPTPPLRLPAVWWSADGANWVKAQLPGARADYPIQMSVCRLDDHSIAVFGSGAWVSNDGQTWKPLAQPVSFAPLGGFTFDALGGGNFLTDGRHGIELQALNGSIEDQFAGGMSLSTWTDGGLVTLAQSGDQPPYDFQTEWAVGPTGVLVTDAGQLWIGLPSPN
jgi:hypothetical protein